MRHVTFLLSLTLWSAPMAAQGMGDVDVRAIARAIADRLALTPGERVLLMAVPGESDALVAELRRVVASSGATDLGALSVRGDSPIGWGTDFTGQLRGKDRMAMSAALAGVDAAVMLPGATPQDIPYAAMQDVIATGKGRTVHFHWSGAYGLDGALVPVTPERAKHYEHVLRNTDYVALARTQREFEQAMRNAVVRVTTPAGTDISFRIGDRPVTRQDGDASKARAAAGRNLIDREVELPAGAIRVAPLAESVSGTIVFPPAVWDGEPAEGVTLSFAHGRVTGIKATRGATAVERELAKGGDWARTFREFALGFNPLLVIPRTGAPWIPYYGYGAGVVRLSLGDNSELVGHKLGTGYVRWNFFTNATVRVGDRVWVQDGALVRE